MRIEHLQEFIHCYNPANRHQRTETYNEATNPEGRWRKYSYEEIIARDKTSLDIFWLKDTSLLDTENMPEPDVLVDEMLDNLQAVLAALSSVKVELNTSK